MISPRIGARRSQAVTPLPGPGRLNFRAAGKSALSSVGHWDAQVVLSATPTLAAQLDNAAQTRGHLRTEPMAFDAVHAALAPHSIHSRLRLEPWRTEPPELNSGIWRPAFCQLSAKIAVGARMGERWQKSRGRPRQRPIARRVFGPPRPHGGIPVRNRRATGRG